MSTSLVNCPTNCEFALPEFSFSECNPKVLEGQITDIFLANIGNPLVNWTDVMEWASRVSNTDAGADAIRHLTVIGDQPAPEINQKTISHKRTVTVTKKRTINIKIDDNTDLNYQAMRYLECGGSFLMWYMTNSGKLYGGNEGIKVTIDLSEVIPEATEENALIQGTAKWDAKISPPRIDSPFTLEDIDPV